MIRSRKKTVAVLLGVIGLSLAGVGWLFVKGRVRPPEKVEIPVEAAKALMKLVGVHQVATKNGAVQWELDARSAELEAKSGQMILDSPDVNFYLEDGGMVHVTAKKGILDTRSKDIEVKGNVEVHDNRYTLLTEALIYKHGARVMESPVPVKITGGTIDVSADAMTYDLEKNIARFDGHVVGHVNEDFSI
ncbi:MAG: LPS export ABC transporter periplasmic protein LptC [Desulfosarcinaceae bacterium]